jgi:predicted phosphodiesterase
MANYSKENYEYIKRLIGNGIFVEDFNDRCTLSGDEIQSIFCAFRSQHYRIFLTELQGLPYYATKETYMQLNNIHDELAFEGSSVKLCIVADSHYGSIEDNPRATSKIIDFCIDMGIHDVIHLGDVVEGNDYHILYNDANKLRYPLSEEKQLAYLQGAAPYSEGITFHVNEGNHDVFSNTGIANDVLFKFINEYGRKDIKIVGYDFSKLKINNSYIYLNHGALPDVRTLDLDYTKNAVISGHSHMTDWIVYPDEPTVFEKKVVSCSNIKHGNDKTQTHNNFTGFSTLDIYFDNNQDFKQFTFKDYKIDESLYSKPVCIGCKQTVYTRRLTK